ncbi:hypothetical protein OG323_06370 [Streptomyces cyaneofuscatus]|uniref:hypothetical protein n=1 Tax=Streptomyces cyaneofuscatus TaxID=66883 RepID=UPI003866BC71|nr:hypothetical protein OG323_06370 [Streptomyces cyaneofuscatus]
MTTTTISTSAGPVTVAAESPAPGLLIFEVPAEVSPSSPYRWVLAHHEGAALAAFESSAAAALAAEGVADLADWSHNAMTAANQISLGGHVKRLQAVLTAAGGQHPNA